MNCDEFNTAWNEILDSETLAFGGSSPAVDGQASLRAALEQTVCAHAQNCPRCLRAHRRYETLRTAFQAARSKRDAIPEPLPTLATRVIANSQVRTSEPRSPRFVAAIAGLAACLLVGFWIVPRSSGPSAGLPDGAVPVVQARSVQPSRSPSLSLAMADATAATWDLAQATSGPATRLSRTMFETASLEPDRSSTSQPVLITNSAFTPRRSLLPSMFRLSASSRPGPSLVQELGHTLSSGVRPLSSITREAFGFLRAPSLEAARPPHRGTASKGA